MSIVIDTSALVAIIRAEDDAAAFVDIMGRASSRSLSVANYLEAGLVLRSAHQERERFLRLVERGRIDLVEVSSEQARIGLEAHDRYGRGSGHPARLNIGDCFAYALAKAHDLPLLFKGDDFIHTDIEPALRRPEDRSTPI